MPNYNNTVIYKIKHNEDYDDLNIYVGSTTNFRGRKHKHKSNCNNENSKTHNFKIYQYIRNNGGWDQFVMVLIEEYSCNSNNEKEIRERYHIDILKPKLNCKIPTRTEKERYENNKDKIKKKRKEHYENNKEQMLEKAKIYRDNNKKQIKKYRDDNKQIINEKGKEEITCECGSIVRKDGIKRHEKSLKHKNFILALNKE
jgi:hypothetical protein